MKLAELLQQRSDIQTKIRLLNDRIQSNITYQEGEAPVEEPNALISELEESEKALEKLVHTINITNTQVVVEGKSLTEWIAHKDSLKSQINYLSGYLRSASYNTNRSYRTEIKSICAVDVKALRDKVDSLSAELRKTDNLIQSTNWTTEV